jgi:hypothetical protein
MYATTELSKQVYCTVSAGFARFRWLASARGYSQRDDVYCPQYRHTNWRCVL